MVTGGIKLDNTQKKNLPKQKRSENTRQKILSAAYELFSEKGYHATNITEIASRAGVSIGGLYGRYSDKLEIFYDVYDDFFSSKLTPIIEMLKETDPNDFDTFIDKLISTYVSFYKDYGKLIKELHNMMDSDPEISRHFFQKDDVLMRGFMGALSDYSVPIEKIYISYYLLNAIGLEHSNPIHTLVDLDKLTEEIKALMLQFRGKIREY